MNKSHITDKQVEDAKEALYPLGNDWLNANFTKLVRGALEAAFPEESPVYAFTDEEWQEWLAQHPILQHNS